jgi:hypothetical protein
MNIKIIVCLVATLFGSRLYAQDCTPEALAQKQGTWKAGTAGSVRNVTAAELAKEKAVLANIHKMISASYKPMGAQALYANAFDGPDPGSGKNWVAGNYWYSIYVLRYFCDENSTDKSKFTINPSTATTLNIYANVFNADSRLTASDLSDDDFRGYLKLRRKVEKKDGYYFVGEEVVGDSHLPKKTKEYRWLITYSDTLPFYYVSRKEYLLLTKKRLEKTIKENGNSSGYYTPFMKNIEDWLKKPESELSKPAICMWNDEESFNGFVEEGIKGSFFAIKPNMTYYRKKLARSTPQFFYVVFKVAESSGVEVDNMNAIKKAVDFKMLRGMLGK